MADSEMGDSNPPHTGYRPLLNEDYGVDEFKPENQDEEIAALQDRMIANMGPRSRIGNVNGHPVLLPGRSSGPPQLITQLSLPTYIADNLHINMIGKNDTEKKALVQGVIEVINIYLSDVNLYWDTTYEKLTEKLRLNPQYLGSTLYNIWLLRNGGDLAMSSSLRRRPDSKGENNVLIDYSNLKLVLQNRCSPRKVADDSLAQEIIKWIDEKTKNYCSRIIISIQENDKEKPQFKSFYAKLLERYGIDRVIIIIGSDGSSYDDLNIAYIVTNLLPLSKKYIISNDKFDDLKSIATHGNPKSIFTNTDKLEMIKLKEFCISTGNTYTESGPTRQGPIRPGFSGDGSREPGFSGDGYGGPSSSSGSGSGFSGHGYGGPISSSGSRVPVYSGDGSSRYDSRRDGSRGDGFRGDGFSGDGSSRYDSRRDGSRGDGSSRYDSRRDGSRGDGSRGDGSRGDGFSRYDSRGPGFSGDGSRRDGSRRGGTNKNKKSLLNKYTRKVKKLHKKRIPTKKVVKKYNKNYKNYKKKTLKRKHK